MLLLPSVAAGGGGQAQGARGGCLERASAAGRGAPTLLHWDWAEAVVLQSTAAAAAAARARACVCVAARRPLRLLLLLTPLLQRHKG